MKNASLPRKHASGPAVCFLKLTALAVVAVCALAIVPFGALAGLYTGKLARPVALRQADGAPSLRTVARTISSMGGSVAALPYGQLKPGNPIGAGGRWVDRHRGAGISFGG